MLKQSGAQSTPAATGCFKCGRPGHWSRDCTYSATTAAANGSSSKSFLASSSSSNPGMDSSTLGPAAKHARISKEPLPKLPRTRPKLTPELLLSKEGLGYVLENFPQMVKIRGPGHEEEDLKSLIEAYMHWHSRLLPYFTFDQFVEKVEKFSGTKRVRMCIREMREKVEKGETLKVENNEKGTPQEGAAGLPAVNSDNFDNGSEDAYVVEPQSHHEPDEDIVEEFFRKATDESLIHPPGNVIMEEQTTGGMQNECTSTSSEINAVKEGTNAAQLLLEEQRARMEANKLKALERAKARMTSS